MTPETITADTLVKVLRPDRMPMMGRGQWPESGEWREVEGPLVQYQNGLHSTTAEHLLDYLGPCLWLVEIDGERIEDGREIVSRRARLVRQIETWNERTQRLFAADCAEHVLPIYERAFPDDDRPRQSIEVARRFANGTATSGELAAAEAAAEVAAEVAAGAAARAAAWVAARAAERAWQVERLLAYLDDEVPS